MKTYIYILFGLILFASFGCEADQFTESVDAVNPNGKGGSLARFTVVGDKLYTIDNDQMRVFDIEENTNPTFEQTVDLISGVETVFPYNNYLYLGTQTGMLIYDISNPSAPAYVSMYEHVQACDPVVVQDNYAYVTIRSGTTCRNTVQIDQLEVIDVSNPTSPFALNQYPLENPYGLGIDNNLLFVCDGNAGLKVFDVTFTPDRIELLHQFEEINAKDVIPHNGLLLLIAEEGFYQYQYKTSGEMELLSLIEVEEE
ncbi:LVIVD repeat-containing protein [Bernardetia sp.]|uniref:LVIVD repeat-containing protein n=1 Tax=Bernardetia sp. TaxID=1937974 RepID=UPI0025B7FD9B|nr:hypothetical protein [Bernardetia sp.]